jgi:hypothetical protein
VSLTSQSPRVPQSAANAGHFVVRNLEDPAGSASRVSDSVVSTMTKFGGGVVKIAESAGNFVATRAQNISGKVIGATASVADRGSELGGKALDKISTGATRFGEKSASILTNSPQLAAGMAASVGSGWPRSGR